MYTQWTGGEQDGTPDGPKLHSVIVDPTDAHHLYIGMSSGGVFESVDKGADWSRSTPGLRADFFPDPHPEDRRLSALRAAASAAPQYLYLQNHCGIYRMDRSAGSWSALARTCRKRSVTSGFRSCFIRASGHCWVSHGMDIGVAGRARGQAASYVTRDSGQTWQRQDQGLPQARAGSRLNVRR